MIFQKLHRRYQDYSQNKYQFVQADSGLRDQDLIKSRDRKEKIKTMIEMLQGETSIKLKSVLDQNLWFMDSTLSELNAL